jgi:hypothetical protein
MLKAAGMRGFLLHVWLVGTKNPPRQRKKQRQDKMIISLS